MFSLIVSSCDKHLLYKQISFSVISNVKWQTALMFDGPKIHGRNSNAIARRVIASPTVIEGLALFHNKKNEKKKK